MVADKNQAHASVGKQAGDSLGRLPPVVAIAASAGGLKAFRQLISNLPQDTGMAYVLIQHLDPTHKSILAELLDRDSAIPVVEISDGMQVQADHVYVIPPNHHLSILHDSLQFIPEVSNLERHRPADTFFRSLAEDRGRQAIGVVLSGTATDGTLGCLSIKAAGGTTFAQAADSAEHDGMPTSAVAAGCVDFVLTPQDIARELARIAHHPSLSLSMAGRAVDDMVAASADQMSKIFILLRSRTGHDFSFYKPTTIKRRISKRMMVHKCSTIADYIGVLQSNVTELDALFHDLLINVTAFFRDPEGFEELRRKVLPRIIDKRPADLPVRIWVPACSTGQEAYSIAILLQEYFAEHALSNPPHVQIFGSDIDQSAVEAARNGLYAETYLNEMPVAQRERYFYRVAGGYQVKRQLRDMCVFAVQSLIKDPPFSRLDLVSCRNLMIYFNAALQKKVLNLLHYSLLPGGFLMLGTSESIGNQSELFSTVSKKQKIYQKKAVAARLNGDLVFRPGEPAPTVEMGTMVKKPGRDANDIEGVAERLLLQTYAPPGVVVGPDGSILRYLGRTWPYIEPSSGAASLNLFKNSHPDILVELRAAIHGVGKKGMATRKDDVRMVVDGEERRVDINVMSLGGAAHGEENLLVVFEPSRPSVAAKPGATDGAAVGNDQVAQLTARNSELEREISSTRQYMQSIVEEQEGTNEELRSANEEIQSTNEELQSTNEELETAKEELQSTNEELATVNEELETRNHETNQANSDMVNLLASINIPIVILGADLRIRQFTKPAETLLNLIDTDIGRPIGNIHSNIEIPDLEREVMRVIDAMESHSLELADNTGRWYSVRLRPYRSLDKRIDGAVLTFIDINDLKDVERTRADLESERRLAAIVRDSNDAILLQDFDGQIRAWNPAAERILGYPASEALGKNIRSLVPPAEHAGLTELYARLRTGKGVEPFVTTRLTRDGTAVRLRVLASVLLGPDGKPSAVATIESPLD